MSFSKPSLVQRLKGGDFKVIDHLRNHLLPRIYALTKDKNQTEEIIQETLVRLWSIKEKVQEGKLEAFTYKMAKNVWYEHTRKKRHLNKEINSSISDTNKNAIQTIIHNEYLNNMAVCLKKLPSEAQKYIAYHHVDGVKIKTIAAEIGVKEGTMRKRFFKWRSLLKGCINSKMEN